eukprot:4297986-Amphidinium_carterae.1
MEHSSLYLMKQSSLHLMKQSSLSSWRWSTRQGSLPRASRLQQLVPSPLYQNSPTVSNPFGSVAIEWLQAVLYLQNTDTGKEQQSTSLHIGPCSVKSNAVRTRQLLPRSLGSLLWFGTRAHENEHCFTHQLLCQTSPSTVVLLAIVCVVLTPNPP